MNLESLLSLFFWGTNLMNVLNGIEINVHIQSRPTFPLSFNHQPSIPESSRIVQYIKW
jgi:hypothetical protein